MNKIAAILIHIFNDNFCNLFQASYAIHGGTSLKKWTFFHVIIWYLLVAMGSPYPMLTTVLTQYSTIIPRRVNSKLSNR